MSESGSHYAGNKNLIQELRKLKMVKILFMIEDRLFCLGPRKKFKVGIATTKDHCFILSLAEN